MTPQEFGLETFDFTARLNRNLQRHQRLMETYSTLRLTTSHDEASRRRARFFFMVDSIKQANRRALQRLSELHTEQTVINVSRHEMLADVVKYENEVFANTRLMQFDLITLNVYLSRILQQTQQGLPLLAAHPYLLDSNVAKNALKSTHFMLFTGLRSVLNKTKNTDFGSDH